MSSRWPNSGKGPFVCWRFVLRSVYRMNPCTVSWYVPLLEEGGALDRGDLDAKFRRRLPDELYAGRLVYRGLMMKTCNSLKMLDGVAIGTGERTKAYALLERASSSGCGVKR